jgi:autotransporter-associated beta strand protein
LRLEALEDRLAPATDTWTGLGADTSWSTVGNWSSSQVPQAGDDLVFPAVVQNASTNDLAAGTAFNSITFSGSGYNLSGAAIVLGSATAGSGSLLASAGTSNNTIALDVQLGGAAGNQQDFTVNSSATLIVSGQVSGSTGVELDKDGTGTLIFTGANSYTGPTTISAGVLNIQNNASLGDASNGTVVVSGATLQVQGGITFSSEPVTLNGPGFNNQGALQSVSGNNTWARALTLGSDSTIGVAAANDKLAFVVAIDDGGQGFGLTKTGAGELVFDTAPTYTGLTTITQGSVDVPQGVALGGVALNGGTLAGRGSVGQLQGTSGGAAVGTVSPGDPLAPLPTGVLSSGNTTWGTGTTFSVDLSDQGGGTPQPGSDYDQLVVNGNINLGGAALAGTVQPGVPFGASFTLVRTTGGGQITGHFAEPFSPGETFIDGSKFQVDYSDPTKVVLTRVRKEVSLEVSASPNPSSDGQDVVFSAAVVPEPGAGSVPALDTVLFKLDGQDLQTVNVGSSGVATLDYQTLTNQPLSVGTHSLVAVFGGDSDFMGQDNSLSPVTLTVNPGTAQMTLSSAPTNPVFGQAVTVTATVAAVPPAPGVPTGSVNFTVDGQPYSGNPVPLDANGTATIMLSGLGVGAHPVTATYSGDASFQAIATPAPLSFSVASDASRVVLVTTPGTSVYGQAVVLTAQVIAGLPGSGTPAGSVTFFDAGHELGMRKLDIAGTASLRLAKLGAAGTHHLSAVFTPGNVDFLGSTGTRSHTVKPARTTVAIASSVNPAVFGQTVTFTATVRSSAPSTAVPQGTITFTVDGKALGSVALNARGKATLSLHTLAVAAHKVYATYHPSSNFLASTDRATPLLQQVRQASSKVTLTSSASAVKFGQAVTLTVRVAAVPPGAGTPTGSVTFKDGMMALGTVNLVKGTAKLTLTTLPKGKRSISALYTSDADFLPGVSAAVTVTVS